MKPVQLLAAASDQINLEQGWNTLIQSIEGALGGLLNLMTAIGVAIVVFGIGKYIWDKRKGGGGNSSSLVWTIVAGALLAAPKVIIPITLKLVDWLANAAVSLFNSGSAG